MRKKNQSNEFIRECIGNATFELMKTIHFYDISISSICKKAGFGRTTYYRHFPNRKEDIIISYIRILWKKYKNEHIDAVKNDEGKELMKYMYANKNIFLLIYHQNLFHILYDFYDQEFGVDENDDPILAYGKSMFVGLFFGVGYEWMKQGCKDSADEISKKIEQGIAIAVALSQKNQIS